MVRVALPLAVLAAGGLIARRLILTPPAAKRRKASKKPMELRVRELTPTNHRVVVRSHGTVRPHMRSTLALEVAGRVLAVSPEFRAGAFVHSGTVLLRLDPREQQLAVRELTAQLASADAALQQLEVELTNVADRVSLARERAALQKRQLERVENLRKRGVDSEADLLDAQGRELGAREALQVLLNQQRTQAARRPRLSHDKAVIASRLARARLDLARTVVRAPFRACVVERTAGEGQYLSRGASIGTLYDVDRVEVALPLSSRRLARLELPGPDAPAIPVTLTAEVDGEHKRWEGKVVRVAGAVDRSSRQLAVIAEVEDPFSLRSDARGRPPLRPGTYVTAAIRGRLLEQVFEVPRSATVDRGVVLVAGPTGDVLRRRTLEVLWRTPELLVVRGGLSAGERLCVTPVSFAGDELRARLRPEGTGSVK